jgi:hypothetical protein
MVDGWWLVVGGWWLVVGDSICWEGGRGCAGMKMVRDGSRIHLWTIFLYSVAGKGRSVRWSAGVAEYVLGSMA